MKDYNMKIMIALQLNYISEICTVCDCYLNCEQ